MVVCGQGFVTVYKGTENLTFVRVESSPLTYHILIPITGGGGGVFVSGKGFVTVYRVWTPPVRVNILLMCRNVPPMYGFIFCYDLVTCSHDYTLITLL